MVKVIFGILAAAILVFLIILNIKSKKQSLWKWAGIVLFAAILLTWLVPYGTIQGSSFSEVGMIRIGLTDTSTLIYYAIQLCIYTLLFLACVGGFYGVISKTKSYNSLVKSLAKSVSNNPVLSSMVIVILLVGLSSVSFSNIVLFAFAPFITSVLLNAKFDKVTAFGVSFGSILVGTLCATLGSEGLYWFNHYAGFENGVGLRNRVIVSIASLVLFLIFTIVKVMKRKTSESKEDASKDTFAVSEETGAKWPAIVIMCFLFVVAVLGFVDWNNYFNISIFDTFHTWLMELSLDAAKEQTIIQFLLGNGTAAFGAFTVQLYGIFLIFAAFLAVLFDGMKFSEGLKSFIGGIGKVATPIALFLFAYVIFIVSYMSPFMSFISYKLFSLVDKFNPFLTAVVGFTSSIFHPDLGYTGYLVGSYITSAYASNIDLVHAIFTTTFAHVQLLLPCSGALLFGLAYAKVDYKSWFKHIWLYMVGAIIILVVLMLVA